MDVDAKLSLLRELLNSLDNELADGRVPGRAEVIELMCQVYDLDSWLSRGGIAPAAWRLEIPAEAFHADNDNGREA
jgi:NADH:ubiquinone oxidoreductase subunit E